MPHDRDPAFKPHSSFVLCPFYLREASKSVTCEGVEPGTVISTKTKTAGALRTYKMRYCCCYEWRQCMVAQALLIAHGEQWNFRKGEQR